MHSFMVGNDVRDKTPVRLGKVLLLNNAENILGLVSWKKAVKLYFGDKAIAPYGYEDTYTVHGVNKDFYLPTALIVDKYIRHPHRDVSPTRDNVFRRDRHLCQYCGVKLFYENATIDHIIPQSKGGRHTWKNMVTCCKNCNSTKSDRTLEESGMVLKNKPYAPTREELVVCMMTQYPREAWSRWIQF